MDEEEGELGEETRAVSMTREEALVSPVARPGSTERQGRRLSALSSHGLKGTAVLTSWPTFPT